MLTSEERSLLQRHVSIDGDGNVVGNDNTVQVTKVDAEAYVAEINDRRIAFTVQDLRQIHVQQSQVAGVGDNWHVEGGIHYNVNQTASSDAPKHPQVRHNLPQPDYGEFVGRREELAQVHRILRPYPHSRHAVVTIDGIGGIGKSALALEVAHRYLRDYDRLPDEERFDAIIWTSAKTSVLTADGIAPRQQITRTLQDIYTAIAVTLEREAITRARPEEQDALVTKALTQQRTLLIVDNLEAIEDERVYTFLRELCTPTKAIITTRRHLDFAYPIHLSGMPEAEALDLIAHECKKKSVILTQIESKKLRQRTGGVPLAIMWSVAQMGFGYSVGSVLRRLNQPKADITRFCFENALDNIRDKPGHKLLMALTLFVTSANREALGFITGLPDASRDSGLVTLKRLSLVNRSGDRFSLLPLTKRFSRAELNKHPEFKRRTSRRWVDYLKNLCQPAEGEYYWRYEDYAFHEEGENILAAIEWAHSQGTADDVFTLTLAANDYLDATGQWSKDLALCRRAHTLAHAVQDITAIARFARIRSWFLTAWGQYEAAESWIQESLNQYQRSGNRGGECIALQNLGRIHRKQEQYEQAASILDQAYRIATSLDADDYIAMVNLEHGRLARDQGQWESAWRYFSMVRDWFEQRSDPAPRDEMMARGVSGHMAIVAYLLGRPQEAKRLCLENLDFFAIQGTQGFYAKLQHRLALAEEALGEFDEAVERAREAVDWFDRLGMQPDLIEAQTLLERLIDKKD
jgi:LuxR family glucitol operon transcriptional activator